MMDDRATIQFHNIIYTENVVRINLRKLRHKISEFGINANNEEIEFSIQFST